LKKYKDTNKILKKKKERRKKERKNWKEFSTICVPLQKKGNATLGTDETTKERPRPPLDS
jgi:hypothetical protein